MRKWNTFFTLFFDVLSGTKNDARQLPLDDGMVPPCVKLHGLLLALAPQVPPGVQHEPALEFILFGRMALGVIAATLTTVDVELATTQTPRRELDYRSLESSRFTVPSFWRLSMLWKSVNQGSLSVTARAWSKPCKPCRQGHANQKAGTETWRRGSSLRLTLICRSGG
eukprot:5702628-Amphidinium_carterae.2